MGLHAVVMVLSLGLLLSVGGLVWSVVRLRTLRRRLAVAEDPLSDPVQVRLRWAEWWMRNATEYPDPADLPREQQLRRVAELALLCEDVEALADLLARLPEEDRFFGGSYNVAWQAGREVLAARQTGRPPWAAYALPDQPQPERPAHDRQRIKLRLSALVSALRNGVLDDAESRALTQAPPASLPRLSASETRRAKRTGR